MTSFYRRIPQRTLLGIWPPCIMGRLLNTDRCTLAGLAEETDAQRCLRSHSLVRSGRSQRSPCGRCSTIALRSWGMSSCCTEFANMERVSLAREESLTKKHVNTRTPISLMNATRRRIQSATPDAPFSFVTWKPCRTGLRTHLSGISGNSA